MIGQKIMSKLKGLQGGAALGGQTPNIVQQAPQGESTSVMEVLGQNEQYFESHKQILDRPEDFFEKN